MISELLAAGWRKYKGGQTTWESLWGVFFRGPALAWKIMQLTRGGP